MKLPLLIIRSITGLALVVPAAWLAWTSTPLPLLLLITIAAALLAIRIGQEGEARYGRRVQITEMLALGRQGYRQMLVGGMAGYLMAACLLLALWFAF